MSSAQDRWMELSDVIVDHRADGSRHPVSVADAEARLDTATFASSQRLLRRLPQNQGVFDDEGVDAILLRSHLELQRLAEEIQHGKRVTRLLRPFLDLIPGSKRVIDVGCGLGYLVRYFAATGALGPDVEVIGYDFNSSLLSAARSLAAREQLDCSFVAGDAFALDTPADIFISSGVIHHFRGAELPLFFKRQFDAGAQACFHFDVAPTWLSSLGAWVFHRARMREPLARHDGVRSALRAHSDNDLITALNEGAPEWASLIFDSTKKRPAIMNIMRPVIGMAPALEVPYRTALGQLSSRLEAR